MISTTATGCTTNATATAFTHGPLERCWRRKIFVDAREIWRERECLTTLVCVQVLECSWNNGVSLEWSAKNEEIMKLRSKREDEVTVID